MAREAMRTSDLPTVVEARRKAKKTREAVQKVNQKTFDELTAKEKDQLLKLIAERLGLLKES